MSVLRHFGLEFVAHTALPSTSKPSWGSVVALELEGEVSELGWLDVASWCLCQLLLMFVIFFKLKLLTRSHPWP